MPLDEDYKPRFIFEMTLEQKAKADKFLSQYGMRKAIFQPILDDVLNLIEQYGGVALGIIMSDRAKPREILPSLKRVTNAGDKING